MKATLINHRAVFSTFPSMPYLAGKTSRGFDLDKDSLPDERAQTDFLLKIYKKNHLSVFEHTQFTFIIKASRTCLDQLNRYRHASICMESSRHVDLSDREYVVPDSISSNEAAQNIFSEVVLDIRHAAMELESLGIPKEDLRSIYGMGLETTEVFTVNLRELFWIWKERICKHAQKEIRQVAQDMLYVVKHASASLNTFISKIEDDFSCKRCLRDLSCPNNQIGKIISSHENDANVLTEEVDEVDNLPLLEATPSFVAIIKGNNGFLTPSSAPPYPHGFYVYKLMSPAAMNNLESTLSITPNHAILSNYLTVIVIFKVIGVEEHTIMSELKNYYPSIDIDKDVYPYDMLKTRDPISFFEKKGYKKV